MNARVLHSCAGGSVALPESPLIVRAMLESLPQLQGGCINYCDAGNGYQPLTADECGAISHCLEKLLADDYRPDGNA